MGFMDDLKKSVKHARGDSDNEPTITPKASHHTGMRHNLTRTQIAVFLCVGIAAIIFLANCDRNKQTTSQSAPATALPPIQTAVTPSAPSNVATETQASIGANSPADNEWYSISMTGICDPHDITKFLNDVKAQGDTYTESNIVKDGDKIVSSNIVHHGVSGISIQYGFYRGLNRCKAAWNEIKQKSETENNKYK